MSFGNTPLAGQKTSARLARLAASQAVVTMASMNACDFSVILVVTPVIR